MKCENSILLFNQKQVRRVWDDEKELWYFSIVDVIEVLTDSTIPKRYWSDLKNKLKNEGSEVYEKIVQLKFKASDGKNYATDCFSTEDLLRLIQSVPSPKAEPFKLWLAKVGYERIEETSDPELAFDRAMKTYLQKGYSKEWINQRLKSIEVRKDLTDEWQARGMKEGLGKNKEVAHKGGFVAKKARLEIEKQTGERVVTSKNAKQLQLKKKKFN